MSELTPSISLPRQRRKEEPEWVVWLTLAIGLLIGAYVLDQALNRFITAGIGAGSLQYPARWAKVELPGTLFAAEDVDNAPYGAAVRVYQLTKRSRITGEETLGDAASAWALERGENLIGYRVLSIEETMVNERSAVEVEYAYLANPPQGSASGGMPGLIHGIDTLVVSGDGYLALSFSSEQSDWQSLQAQRQQLLGGWLVP